MTTTAGGLEADLLRLLADGEPRQTGWLIAACQGTPGWAVRRELDRLAAEGRLWWRPGKHNAGSRVWRLAPASQAEVRHG